MSNEYSIVDNQTVHKLRRFDYPNSTIKRLYVLVDYCNETRFISDGRQRKNVITTGYVVVNGDSNLWYVSYRTVVEQKQNGRGRIVSNEWLMRQRTKFTEANVTRHIEEKDKKEDEKCQDTFRFFGPDDDTMGSSYD